MSTTIIKVVIDVAFEVQGELNKKGELKQIPYRRLLAGLEGRYQQLRDNPEPEAFGIVDITETEVD